MIPGNDIFIQVAENRGTLAFLSHAALLLFVREAREEGDKELTEQGLVETMQRAWLYSGGPKGCAEMNAFRRLWQECGLPAGVVQALRQWCGSQRNNRSYRLPSAWEKKAAGTLRARVATLLLDWENADGAIPFVATRAASHLLPAVLTPFRLDVHEDPHDSPVILGNGTAESLNLEKSILTARGLAVRHGWMDEKEHVKLTLFSVPGSSGYEMNGGSGALPTLIALYARREKRRLRPLDCAASGELQPASGAVTAMTDKTPWLRKRRLLETLGVKNIILPDDWKDGAPVAGRIRELVDQILPANGGTADVDDLGRQVKTLTDNMRWGCGETAKVRTRLKRLLDGELNSPNVRVRPVRMDAELALAAAECHLGHTQTARKLAEKLVPGAAQKWGPYQGGLIQVHLAVSVTDETEYSCAAELCDQAIQYAEALPTELEGKPMLLLQAEGTKGQALMYWGLWPERQQERDLALTCLQRALTLARELDGAHQKQNDEPRSLGYIQQWHALHAPRKAEAAWSTALRAAENKCERSVQFLFKNRWLAAYRGHLRGDRLAWWPRKEPELPEPKEDDLLWLQCLAQKYRGTLRAANHNRKGARADFEEACRLLDPRHGWLFRFFGATAALQAGESLAKLDPKAATGFLRRAQKCLEEYRHSFRGPVAGAAWMERTAALLRGKKPGTDPQPHYPY